MDAIDLNDRLRRTPEPRTVSVGSARLTYLPDGDVQLKPRRWLPEAPTAAWTDGNYLDDDGHLVAGIGGLLVQLEGRNILIDAGIGALDVPEAHTAPALGRLRGGLLPESLRRLGVPPESIDLICLTHLHDDHVGWAFPRGQEDLFPRATIAAAEAEWKTWPPYATGRLRALTSRLHHLHDGEELLPGLRAHVTGGHTPGHACFEARSGGQRLTAFGDLMHSPAQVAHPEWRAALDAEPDVTVRARTELLEELHTTGGLAFGVHFADVVFGRVGGTRDRWEWVPAT